MCWGRFFESALGGGRTVLEGAPALDHVAGGEGLEPLLLDPRDGLVGRAGPAREERAPGVELGPQRAERGVELRPLLGQGGGRREGVRPIGPLPGARRERRVHRRDLTVRLPGGLPFPEPLEDLGAREARDVAEAGGEALLPVGEAVERELVEVVPRRVPRRRVAVGVVAHVPGELGDDLQEVLVRHEGPRRVSGERGTAQEHDESDGGEHAHGRPP
jgi:hypothetical protein